MRLSQIFISSSLVVLASSAAIERRHDQAWPEAIRSFFTAAADTLSLIPTSTLDALTPSTCNLATASMPTMSGLPPPSSGLTVYHVAVGRGTQNYTCDPSQASSTPTAVGALATLYNTTCMSCIAPSALQQLPPSALLLPTPKQNALLFPAQALASGHHYFTNSTTPTFNLHNGNTNYGIQFAKVNTKVPVPDAQQQPGPDGSKAVPWLKLTSSNAPQGLPSDESGVKEIFRVNTAGGSAPTTCDGQPSSFQVQYAAEYWFWA